MIAPACAPVSLFAREKAHPAGRTRWIGTARGVKSNAPRGKSVQILCPHDWISGEADHGGRVFVGQDQQNVWTLMHCCYSDTGAGQLR